MPGSAIDDAMTRAVAAVPTEHYDHGRPPWGAVQSTTPSAVRSVLGRLGISPGARVLEVGVGDGYSGALLAELVGTGGQVVSVDTDRVLVERAAALHAERRLSTVTVAHADGSRGFAAAAPYDAVVSWSATPVVPRAWAEQARVGARVATTVYLAPVARMVGELQAVVTGPGALGELRLDTADIEMADRTAGADLPGRFVDAQHGGDLPAEGVVWISTGWRGQYAGHEPTAALELLRGAEYTQSVDLGTSAVQRVALWRDFCAYCIGRDTSNLTAYGVTGAKRAVGVGYSSGRNAAILIPDGEYLANGMDSPALMKLRGFFDDWVAANRPGIAALRPILRPVDAGWQVQTTPLRLARRAPR